MTRLQLYAPSILIAVMAFFYGYQSSNPYLVLFVLLFGSSLVQPALVITGRLRHSIKKQPHLVERAYLADNDFTVRICTVSPENRDFEECLRSVFKNRPKRLDIITDTLDNAIKVLQIVQGLDKCGVEVQVASAGEANKRLQIIYGIEDVETPFIVLMDDHVFLPDGFLNDVRPVFNDQKVALCGTIKCVRREVPQVGGRFRLFKWYWKSFFNFAGAAYLEGHNTVFLALQDLDGGHYVISGRTMLARTAGFQDKQFQHEFMNEVFMGSESLTAGDDNFITRWFSNRGDKIVFTDAATIETTLGESPGKFIKQCARWRRTTFQNAGEIWESLQQQKPATAQTILGMILSAPLFWDPLQVYFFRKGFEAYRWQHTVCFLGFIWLTKFYQLVPYFWKRPKDLVFCPAYLLFIYFHTLISLYSAVTIRSCSWSGRTLNPDDEEGTGWLGGAIGKPTNAEHGDWEMSFVGG